VPVPEPTAFATAEVIDQARRQPSPLMVRVSIDENERVVTMSGELDLASRNDLALACNGGDDLDVVVDMHGITFMDCSGYGGVVSARRLVEGRGNSLTLRGLTGQPARFLELFVAVESR
jgi:anti-anti-sigma factor